MLQQNDIAREDQTIGDEFVFRVASRRSDEDGDAYHLIREPFGWYFRFGSSRGSCDKRGVPLLYSNLRHDGIEYPESLQDRLRSLWLEAYEKNLTHEEVQQALDRLAGWLRDVDEHAPAYEVRVND
ncbi:MAG: hypothetical protein KKI08_07870 [Armatimonadetes bacterium]|nr:hypothetical protein [Armatimonadota bacterium]